MFQQTVLGDDENGPEEKRAPIVYSTVQLIVIDVGRIDITLSFTRNEGQEENLYLLVQSSPTYIT